MRVALRWPHSPTSGVSTPMRRILPTVVTTVSPSAHRITLALPPTAAGGTALTRARAATSPTARSRVLMRLIVWAAMARRLGIGTGRI